MIAGDRNTKSAKEENGELAMKDQTFLNEKLIAKAEFIMTEGKERQRNVSFVIYSKISSFRQCDKPAKHKTDRISLWL